MTSLTIAENAPCETPSGIERFIHSLDGKVYLKQPMTIEEMNEIIAAGWAGKLGPEFNANDHCGKAPLPPGEGLG